MPSHHHHHHHHHHHAATSPSPPPKPNPNKLLSFVLKAIIMALTLSLFFLFLGVAALALPHLLLAAASLRRRRRSPSLSAATTAYTAADLHKYLPRLQYSSGVETAKDCAVCLECFKENEWLRILPACNHVFHANCVDSWLIKVPNCPICRSHVRLNDGLQDFVDG